MTQPLECLLDHYWMFLLTSTLHFVYTLQRFTNLPDTGGGRLHAYTRATTLELTSWQKY